MTIRTMDDIVTEAARLFDLRHHCSEAILMATGQFYLEPFPDALIRASCPLGGGVGGCRDELCGLLSGAILVLGALWGRVSYAEDDKWLYEVVSEYRDWFIAANGTSICRPLAGLLCSRMAGGAVPCWRAPRANS